MWKCSNCGEEITKDKYKVCWNCGTPKPVVEAVKPKVMPIPPKLSSLPKKESRKEFDQKIKLESSQEIKTFATENKKDFPETPINPKSTQNPPILTKERFSEANESVIEERKGSLIRKVVIVMFWLVVVSAIGYFAFVSNQKTEAFEKKIAGEFQNFNSQKSLFNFPPIPVLRRGTVIEGNIKAKVLPLKVKTREIDSIYNFLPDDLRPANIEEVKTLMWLNCENNPVGRYPDGTTGYQEKCTVYLVEKETSKFIGIQDFLGVIPALAKEKTGEDAIGKVLPEKYVTYLREKQIESERGTLSTASDSPNHHIYTKSEFVYALLLLAIFVAVGLGWLAFNIRFHRE